MWILPWPVLHSLMQEQLCTINAHNNKFSEEARKGLQLSGLFFFIYMLTMNLIMIFNHAQMLHVELLHLHKETPQQLVEK